MSESVRSPVVRIRALEFDPKTRSVDVAGRKTLLDARSSSILLALAERLGESVNKDVLLRAGWPTQLVHENSLAKTVSKLRHAIDGSGVEIAAIYGVGYSLRYAEIPSTSAEPEGGRPSTRTSKRLSSGPLSPLMISLCVALLTAAILLFIVEGRRGSAPTRDTPPITNDAPDAIATILWVDDHPSNNSLEVEALRQRHVAVHLAESTTDALELLAINRYKLVVSDLGRGDDRLAGLKMIGAMRRRQMRVPVVIYTVRPQDPAGEEALRRLVTKAGATDLAVTPEEVRAEILSKLVADA